MSAAILLLPSLIVPEEHSALLNPLHPDARTLHARKIRRWLYDPRMTPSPAPPPESQNGDPP